MPVEPLLTTFTTSGGEVDLHASEPPPPPLLQIHEELCCICHELLTTDKQTYKLPGCYQELNTNGIAA